MSHEPPVQCRFTRLTQKISRCPLCGLGKTEGEIKESEFQDYSRQTPEASKAHARYYRTLWRKHLAKTLPKRGTALDIGCAGGQFIGFLEKKGWEAEGVDPVGRPPAGKKISKEIFEHFSTTRRYDLITFLHSFEHLKDPVAVLQKCRSLLVPEGRVLIVVPNFGGVWSRLSASDWLWLNPEEHRFHYTVQSLTSILHQQGFRVERLWTYSPATDCPSVLNVFLSVKNFYQKRPFCFQPLRSLLYRGAEGLKFLANPFFDSRGEGAEIRILAVPGPGASY